MRKKPSKMYRAMIYAAHSTMVIYKKSITSNEGMSVGDFMVINKIVIERVFDEIINVFNYELSHNQMERACYVYLKSEYNPSSVEDTEAYKMEE